MTADQKPGTTEVATGHDVPAKLAAWLSAEETTTAGRNHQPSLETPDTEETSRQK